MRSPTSSPSCEQALPPSSPPALTSPRSIRDLGYKGDKALLMSAPPFVCACAFAFTASFVADRLNKRGSFVMLGNAITMAGMVMLKVGNSKVKYGGTFLAVMGSSVCVTAALAFQGSNCPAPSKKGLASAL